MKWGMKKTLSKHCTSLRKLKMTFQTNTSSSLWREAITTARNLNSLNFASRETIFLIVWRLSDSLLCWLIQFRTAALFSHGNNPIQKHINGMLPHVEFRWKLSNICEPYFPKNLLLIIFNRASLFTTRVYFFEVP